MYDRRFFLGDPSLVDFSGHCHAYLNAMRAELEARGEEVVILANRNISSSLAAEIAAFPIFTLWCDARPSVPMILALSRRHSLAAVRRIHEKYLLQDLRQFAQAYSVRREDVLIINTLRHWGIRAVVNWLEEFQADQAPQVILILHFTAFPDPDDSRDNMQEFYIDAFRKIETSPMRNNVILMADSEALVAEYRQMSDLTFHLTPIPHTNTDGQGSQALCGKNIRIIYPGEARSNKGFQLLPHLTNGFRRTEFADSVEFHIHAYCHNSQQDFYRQAMGQFCGDNVVFYFDQMNAAEYEDFLQSADLVVLPYTRANYYKQTSGPFSEAVGASKPTIVPKGTWMADVSQEYGCGKVFNPEDPQDLLDVTLDAVRNLDLLKEQAKAAGTRWRAFHTSASQIDLVFACIERGGKHVP